MWTWMRRISAWQAAVVNVETKIYSLSVFIVYMLPMHENVTKHVEINLWLLWYFFYNDAECNHGMFLCRLQHAVVDHSARLPRSRGRPSDNRVHSLLRLPLRQMLLRYLQVSDLLLSWLAQIFRCVKITMSAGWRDKRFTLYKCLRSASSDVE